MAASVSAPPPPPPPPSTYPAQPTYNPTPTPVKMPSWLDLGLIVMGVGVLLVLIGFLFGDAAAGQFGNGTLSTFQSDLEFFFVLAGVGFLLIVGGWMMRIIMPQWKARSVASPASSTAPAASTAAAAMPEPASPSPSAAAPPVPTCPSCGRPTAYIAQYGRYYCYSCARYV